MIWVGLVALLLFVFALVERGARERRRLLGVLSDGKERTGLQLRQHHGFGGGVYVYLRSLEDAGLIESRSESGGAERGGFPRRYYRLAKP